jgi:protein SCO1/2
MVMRKRIAGLALLAALLAACGPTQFQSTDITGADFARSLELTGHDGQPRSLSDFAGKVVIVFFGYTQCPDVCPTTLARFAEVVKQLGSDAERVQVLFVTVDPERDTPQVLSQYVPAFDSRFVGLYGDSAAIARTAKEYKVLHQKQAGKTESSYTIDHSAGSFVYDRSGRVRLFVRHETPVDSLVHDIRILLDQ